jgi:hypothetical protein
MDQPETATFEWNGLPVTATMQFCWHSLDLVHIEVRCPERLPVTETGYRSHYTHVDTVKELDGLEGYLNFWFDQLANTKEWQRYWEDRKQLSLF